jgi:hypothetical protein
MPGFDTCHENLTQQQQHNTTMVIAAANAGTPRTPHALQLAALHITVYASMGATQSRQQQRML